MPKVSICIPAYKQTEYLSKLLDSILIQEYKNYEIIITDDTSNNSVKNLLEKFKIGDCLKYYKNEKQLGSPENWNEAIRYAKGEYIKIMHHDDWFTNAESLASFVNLLDENPAADFAFSASHVVFENVKEWTHSITEDQLVKIKEQPNSLYEGNLVGAPTATIFRNRKKIFFDPQLQWLVDFDFYIRLLQQNNSFVYSKQPLVVTFAAKGRVTDYCKDNKQIEVFEYFHVFNKIIKSYSLLQLKNVISNFSFLLSICKKYSIKNIKEIRQCGYKGELHFIIRIYFLLNSIKIKLPQKVYMKILRNLK